MLTKRLYKNKVYLTRFGLQSFQSISNLILSILFLRMFDIKEFGIYSFFLMLSNFFLGVGLNSYLFKLSFEISHNILNFIRFSIIFIFVECFMGLLISFYSGFIWEVILILILRSQSARLQEFLNRLTYSENYLRPLYWILIFRIIQVVFIGLLLFIELESDVILKIIMMIEFFIWITLSITILLGINSIQNNWNFKLLFSKESLFNLRNFILYFFKGQSSSLILGAYSIEGFSVFSACRILASPITIVTPVLSSMSFSSVVERKKLLVKGGTILLLVFAIAIYMIFVMLIGKYFYQYFMNSYNMEYLIFSMIHIIIASLAMFRSIIESEFQGFKRLKEIFRINLMSIPIALVSSIVLIDVFNIYGALGSMIIIEMFMLLMFLFYKKRYGNILQSHK